MIKPLGVALGVLAIAMGFLWIGQGLGLINWPQSSFMLNQVRWAYFGVDLAGVGGVIIWLTLRKRPQGS